MICTYNLTGPIENSCDLIGGLREVGYIANRGDITAYTESNNTVSSLTFDTNKVMYRIFTPVKQPFANTTTEMSEGDVINRFNHTVSFVILDNSPAVAGIVSSLANGKFVAVVNSEFEGLQGVSAYQIYGLDRSLKASSITHNYYENEGGWEIQLTEENAAYAEKFFYDTDLATTKATLEGYCTPASTL